MNQEEISVISSPTAEPLILSSQPGEESPLPEHLTRLPGDSWVVWRWVGLRGAGFPATEVLKLAAPECAAAADQLSQAENQAQKARREALHALQRVLKDESDRKARAGLMKAIRLIRKGKVPQSLLLPFLGAKMISALESAYAHVQWVRTSFYQRFEEATTQLSQAIYDLASTDRFREAVIWQNRHAFQNNIKAFLNNKPGDVSRNSSRRKHEELIAVYLQRYCVKNDTIGFFGPVGWAKVVPVGEAIVVRPGPNLLAKRNVYLEGWCIDTLAERLSEEKALRPWIAPRLLPYFQVEGTTLYRPSQPPARIPAEVAAILQGCDGVRTAKELASELIRNPTLGFQSEAEVYRLLENLCDRGLILWKLEYPVGAPPEQALRRQLERIGDDRLREPALAALDEIEAARRAVVRATGDPERLDQALRDLEATFTCLTGEASTRNAGQIYAGRTLVYEDCRRDLEVEIGPEILQSLGPPLSLLLASARWFAFQAEAVYRQAFRKIYAEFVRETGSPTVDAVTFWQRIAPLVAEDGNLAESLIPAFQQRWGEILAILPGQRHVHYTSQELRSRVLAAFETPSSGRPLARYHSPDVMMAAASAEAIRRGQYQFVLGEFHLGSNTLRNAVFVHQHPSPAELFRAIELDLPGPGVSRIPPRHWSGSSRTNLVLISPLAYRLALSHDACGFPRSQVLLAGELVIEDSGGELVVRTRDGRLCLDSIEVVREALSAAMVNCFKMLPPDSHTPRVTIDRLVICRESWRFDAEQAQFAYIENEADRFVAARRWAQDHGMPRFVFVRVPVESKPFYVDFTSPILVNFFAKTLRQTLRQSPENQLITVTEMLANFDQIWLPDAAGQRYTGEFRIVAVDPATYPGRPQ